MTLDRGWYRFDEWTGAWFWDGRHWCAVMPCTPPEGEPMKADPPK